MSNAGEDHTSGGAWDFLPRMRQCNPAIAVLHDGSLVWRTSRRHGWRCDIRSGNATDGGDTMKTNKTLIKEMRGELRYWQMMVRLDIRSLKLTRIKCKEIAAKMRQLQQVKP